MLWVVVQIRQPAGLSWWVGLADVACVSETLLHCFRCRCFSVRQPPPLAAIDDVGSRPLYCVYLAGRRGSSSTRAGDTYLQCLGWIGPDLHVPLPVNSI